MAETSKNLAWYGKEYIKAFENHMKKNLNRAAIVVTREITSSFGNSGVTGGRSGATRQERAANRSKAWGPPNVDTGHLKRNIGWDRPAGRPLVRRVGTSIGNKESVGYAMWLEFGTRPRKNGKGGILPRPYLRPGLANARDKIRRELTRPMPGDLQVAPGGGPVRDPTTGRFVSRS